MSTSLLEVVARLRQRVDDLGGDLPAAPTGYSYYWEYDDTTCLVKNVDLVRLISESQIEFCRRNPIYSTIQLRFIAGRSTYQLDSGVLAVERAYLASLDRPLVRLYHHQIDEGDERLVLDGEIRYYQVGIPDHTITVIATPTVVDTLQLSVQRLPYGTLAWDSRDNRLEIDDLFIEDLLLYAAYLVYSTRDFDVFNPELANTYAERFRSRVGVPKTASDLQVAKGTSGIRMRTRVYF
jgi:hypothetical protein